MTGSHENGQSTCALCNGQHDLDSCREFCAKDIKDRKEYAKTEGLCFGCLKVGHVSKSCRKRKTCVTCGKTHPTSLHGDGRKTETTNSTPPSEDAANVHCTKTLPWSKNQHVISSMIVPVWISHPRNPGIERLVYALLDDRSDTTFISEKTLNSLKVNGTRTPLSLSTMHAENEIIPSQKIKGLVISNVDGNTQIELPPSFSCVGIPARRQQIPCPKMTESWPHLTSIAPHLMSHQGDVEVGLLIGSNCPDAIILREVIPGNPNTPYAQRTKLGWGIIGNVSKYSNDGDEGNSVIAHRVTTSDLSRVNSQQEKTCYFAIKPTVREVFSPAQLCQMFELDFSERKGSGPSMSQEDRDFLSKMEESAYQAEDGHYVMSLPFRHGTPHLPNNRSLAPNRLSKLRTRLNHDERIDRITPRS